MRRGYFAKARSRASLLAPAVRRDLSAEVADTEVEPESPRLLTYREHQELRRRARFVLFVFAALQLIGVSLGIGLLARYLAPLP